VDGEASQGEAVCRGQPGPKAGKDGGTTLKNSVTAAAIAAMAALAGSALSGCSVSTPAPPEPAQATVPSSATVPASTQHASAPPAQARETDRRNPAAGTKETKEACELFNKLVADYAAVSPPDSKGYEDVYLQAQDAKDAVSGDLQGLFASLGLLAIDHSAAAETGGIPAKESQDAVRDAVFANSAACTAEGVTLRL